MTLLTLAQAATAPTTQEAVQRAVDAWYAPIRTALVLGGAAVIGVVYTLIMTWFRSKTDAIENQRQLDEAKAKAEILATEAKARAEVLAAEARTAVDAAKNEVAALRTDFNVRATNLQATANQAQAMAGQALLHSTPPAPVSPPAEPPKGNP